MAGDSNPTQRAALARYAGNIMGRTFTSSLILGAGPTAVSAWIGELDDADELEIAGRENVRGIALGVLAADLSAGGLLAGLDSGVLANLDGDANWMVRRWKVSPDGAVYTITLLTSE